MFKPSIGGYESDRDYGTAAWNFPVAFARTFGLSADCCLAVPSRPAWAAVARKKAKASKHTLERVSVCLTF